MEHVVVVLKPGFLHLYELLKKELQDLGLDMITSKRLLLDKEQAHFWRQDVSDKPYYKEMVDYHLSGECIVTLWFGEQAITKALVFRGNYTDTAQTGFRGKYGESPVKNVIHVSTKTEWLLDMTVFFPDLLQSETTL